jgi:hypothetical protein
MLCGRRRFGRLIGERFLELFRRDVGELAPIVNLPLRHPEIDERPHWFRGGTSGRIGMILFAALGLLPALRISPALRSARNRDLRLAIDW